MFRNRIHIFKTSLTQNFEKACYFLERNFGNLLIYPRHLQIQNIPQDFFKSKGGIYRQLDTDFDLDQMDMSAKLFDVYGAAYVTDSSHKDKRLLCQKFGVDMFDHYLDFCEYGVLAYQNKKSYLFLSDNYLLDRGVVRDIQTFEEVEIKGVCYEYLYASYFRGVNHIHSL